MQKTKKIAIAALLLAATIYLPFLTGQIQVIGSMISPMHIPVLLCGFIVGGPYAMLIGAIAPVLRFFMYGMPPLFPVGIAMTFELAGYGLASGIFYKMLPKKPINVYVSLIGAMIIGRLAWGLAMFVLAVTMGVEFSLSIFITGAFVKAIPGIAIHIALIPVLVIALEKAGFIYNK